MQKFYGEKATWMFYMIWKIQPPQPLKKIYYEIWIQNHSKLFHNLFQLNTVWGQLDTTHAYTKNVWMFECFQRTIFPQFE